MDNNIQNQSLSVVRPVTSIVLATLMAVSFCSTMAILGKTSQVLANPLKSQQVNHLQINEVITSPSSIVGNWKGSLYSQGDDVVTSVEMVIKQGANQQGTWKFIGENNTPFESGAVVASVGANNVNLEFKQTNKKPSWFFKCKLPNNTKLSCEKVGNTLTKLTLKKI
ncbi:hypothetical protein [Microcoleus sp. PH2017_28_MFU_U_A]|uniref:hypothetical protein n=1 Tax=Microcoleus sp. PH2017_28_MFU_U_A TaxID=2798838 RepID=UPI001D90659E|nr:hypothetical protein [Microcoleus sp. PH2017_28_MFU_U_A]MCC3591482.1 hypothetical protein [Microcoleus sp. PH2017_28_MFU_U_A]